MINNQKYSDMIFVVNNTHIYASKHVVSGASEYIESLILCSSNGSSNHSINIANIKNTESFMVILRYLYGVGINFSKMNTSVMHEVLHLCELYKLPVFAKELQNHLSNLNNFSLDSAVALLNYSEKSNVKVLYDKLIIYAYTQAEKLVKHESFVHLNYKVLVALLKSDSFCAQEIDILTAILKWHEKSATNGLVVSGDPGKAPTQMSSHEVLKSLLSHVRISRIVVLDLMNAYKTELFSKYKDVLGDNKLGDLQTLVSLESKSRNQYVQNSISRRVQPVSYQSYLTKPYEKNSNKLQSRVFKVSINCSHEASSNDAHIIEGMTWKLKVNLSPRSTSTLNMAIDLQCSSGDVLNWDVSTDCRMKIQSYPNNTRYPNMFIPAGTNQYKSFKLNSKADSVNLTTYTYYKEDSAWVSAYAPNKVLTIEVIFSCLHVKGLVKSE